MKKTEVYVQDIYAGTLEETEEQKYIFSYDHGYSGPPVSLTMPIHTRIYSFEQFPPFFEGLLPEGVQLEALLRTEKLNRNNYFAQLMTVGADLVGDVSVKGKL